MKPIAILDLEPDWENLSEEQADELAAAVILIGEAGEIIRRYTKHEVVIVRKRNADLGADTDP